MPIPLASNFKLGAALPLDSRFTKDNLSDLNAIPSGERYIGLEVYVISESKFYLWTGSTWIERDSSANITYPPQGIVVSTGTDWDTSIIPSTGYMYYTGSNWQFKNEEYALSSHTHTKAQITDFSHNHPISEVTNLQSSLDAKVNTSDVVITATANKILKLNANAKLPASITGNADGNAATASKLQTARTITLSGDVSGSASFDGSANAAISTALSNTGVAAGTYTKLTVDSKGRATAGTNLSASDLPTHNHTKSQITDFSHTHIISDVTNLQTTLDSKVNTSDVVTTATANKILKLDANAKLPASITGNADGNASTATKLQTARAISLSGDVTGSANFDGSGNISINATVVDDSHVHDSRYYTESEIQNNDISMRRLLVNTNGVPTSNLSNPTVAEMALFEEQFNNKLAFYDISKFTFEVFDGTTWTDVTSSISTTDKKRLVGGDNTASIVILNGATKYRITIRNNGSYVYINALYMYWSSNGNSSQIHIWKKRDDGNWVQHTNSSTSVSAWPGHLYLPFATIPWSTASTSGHYNDVRIEFTPTWNNANNITLSKLQIWGGYPAGKRNIYSIDENKNVTFPASVTATTFNGDLSGKSASADKLATARTLTIGNTGKSVNGTSDVSWSLAEIGAAAASHTHSDYTPFASNSQTIPMNTPSGAWYRIAASAVNVGRCDGLFELEFAGSGYHQRVSFRASSMYNSDDSIQIVKMGGSKYRTDNTFVIQSVRVVYYPNTYSGVYAYVEVFVANPNTTNDATLNVRMVDAIGWGLTTGAGSIPTNYTAIDLALKNHNPYYSNNDKRKVITPSSGVLNIDLRLARNETVVSNITQNTTINISGLYDGAAGTIMLYLNGTYTITLGTMTNDVGSSVTKHTSGTFSSLAAGYYIIAYRVLPDASGTWRVFISISPKYS